ncbi:MAG TPA: TonB-dependent receptor, partial [Bacteroidales bacterium]
MKKTISLWILMIIVLIGHAQTLTVRDEVDRQPLDMVTIASENPKASTITNTKGKADISAFKGAELINVRILGYESANFSYSELESMNFIVFMKQSNISLDEVVISATRWEQSKTDVPTKITKITSFDISFQNPQTSADMLSNSGFVFVQKSQLGGGSPMIRGFSTNRILITVDGVRFNNAIFRSGNLQNVISVDPFTLESTEVIFGPGSVIYGSDAIGGVMNFYTLTPNFSTTDKAQVEGNAVARYSSAAFEKTGHFDFNIGLKKWSFLTSATFTDFDDLKMGKNGPEEYLRLNYVETFNGVDSMMVNPNPEIQVPTGYSQLNLMQKVRFAPNKSWDFNYIFQYSTTSNVPRYDRLLRYKDGVLRSAEWYYGPQDWMTNSLTITNIAGLKMYDVVKLTTSFQIFKESRHDRDFGKTTLYNRYEKVNALDFNLDLEKKLNAKNHFFYGLEALFNTVYSSGDDENIETGESIPGPSRYPDQSTWNSFAAYFNYLLRINEKVKLQTGLRYTYVGIKADFDTTFFPFPFTSTTNYNSALNGSVGVIYTPSLNWLVNAAITTGFRAPNIDDMGKVFDSEPGNVIVPNPDLKPEYAWNFEIDVAKVFGKLLKLDVAAYYTLLDNALVRRDYTLDGIDSIYYDGEWSNVQAIQNAANAYIYGVQIGLDMMLPKGFGISSQFNFQKGEEELDDGSTAPLRHAAPWFGLTHFTWKWNRIMADLY